MELTNLSHSEAKSHYNSSLNIKKTALNRLSNGSRLNMPGVDAGALSVSMKLSSNQKVLNGKMTGIQNTLSYLNAQEGAINSAMKIMDRISQLKILASAPTISNVDKASYNKEFIELSDQLNSLKQQSFNKISLFSEIETGAGLFSASTEALNISAQNGNSASISRHVIDFEDLRYITEAGDAAKRGFGGIDVAYFPSTESQKQEELITIGGNIGFGDEFRFSVRELSALLETESDTDYYHLAASDNEDPEYVRDQLFDQISSDANVMRFLDVEKVGTDSFKMTAKMKGDPYLVHSDGSTGSRGSISNPTTVTAGTLNDAQEDTLTIDLGAASLLAGDQVSLVINGQTISYTASASDEINDQTRWAGWGESRLATQIANRINNNASVNDDVRAISNRRMVSGNLQYSLGSVLIHSKERGTGFNANNQNLTLQSVNSPTTPVTLSTTSPNTVGSKKEVSVNIRPDDNSAGGGEIAIGDVYTIRITESHPDETANRYNFFNDNSQTYTVNVDSANMTHDDIRNAFLQRINNRGASNNGSYNAVAGASGELIITERNAGDTFSVSRSVSSGDSLTKTQIVPNVSPFSIESSMNFLSEMLSQNGAEQSRLKIAHENLEEHYTIGEQAISRISDADTAKEATRLAKSSLKMGLATQVMSKASRLTDLLTPLTTEHFRSAVLSATL